MTLGIMALGIMIRKIMTNSMMNLIVMLNIKDTRQSIVYH
jgi:hypothetical protein